MKKLNFVFMLLLFPGVAFSNQQWLPFSYSYAHHDGYHVSIVGDLFNRNNLKVINSGEVSNYIISENYFDDNPLADCSKDPVDYRFISAGRFPGEIIIDSNGVITYSYVDVSLLVYEETCGSIVEMCMPDYDSGFPGGMCSVVNLPRFW